MVDFDTRAGRMVRRRLRLEQVVWLTTVDANGTPQPRPVWFHWDGETVLIFSQPHAAKVRHIASSPRVALNFNTDAGGGDVAVLIGSARILQEPVPPKRMDAYARKYRQAIKDVGSTRKGMFAMYSTPILVEPESVRGM